LFVQADGGLKILDFGIARLASSSMTMSGMIMGTPDYMSPEQAQGQDVDARSDIFSAAGVFYFMLTGRRPFEASALPAVLHKVVRENPLPIRAHEAPSALAAIISKALHKDPAQRYQRCGDMAADIVRFKRQFDKETRDSISFARDRFDQVIALVSAGGELRRTLDMTPSETLSNVDRSVRERYPFFATGDRHVAATIPLPRDRVTAILEELTEIHTPLASGVAALRAAIESVIAGEAALSDGNARTALRHFARASAGLPDPSARIDALAASARKAAGTTIESQLQEEMRLAESAKAETSPPTTAQPELEAARIVDDARMQSHAGNYDRAAWLAENALWLCPGYEPALQLLAQARTSLAAGALADPDDTVVLSAQHRVESDPAATVIITPLATSRARVQEETWASKLRRRLHLVRTDTKGNASQDTRGRGSR
jgi:hypothetical protein